MFSILFLGVNIPVVIKSYGYKNGDYVSISIDSKELCPNKPGVNVVVMDFLTFQVISFKENIYYSGNS